MKYLKEIKHNKYTLTFSGELENEFRNLFFNDSLKLIRIALPIIIFLYLLGAFLDIVVVPDKVGLFHFIRFVVVIPIIAVLFVITFLKVFQKIWQQCLLITFIIGGSGISLMISQVPDNFIYYMGLMLVFSSGYFFVNLRFIYATLGGWINVLIVNILVFTLSEVDFTTIFAFNFFYISANFINMFAAYYIELYNRNNFLLNRELMTHRQNLEIEVERRTRKLLESEEKYKALVDNSFEGILILNTSGKIMYGNPTFINMVEVERFEEIFNRNIFDFIASESIQNVIDDFKNVIKGIDSYVSYYKCITAKSNIIWVESIGKLIDFDGEKVDLVTIRDISKQKEAEEILIKAREKAEESDKLKSAFLQNISHEIRTPLNGIMGFSKLLSENNNTIEEKEEYQKLLNHSCNRLLNTVNDIIHIAQIDAQSTEIIKSECYPYNIIQNLYEYYFEKFNYKNLDFKVVLDNSTQGTLILSDEKIITQILDAFISNALKFTSKGIVTFGFNIESDRIKFFVSDSGVGIPEESQNKIFDRFYQADLSISRGFEGSGLGLSIAKGLADIINGKIEFDSKLGKGSTFYFILPLES